MESFRKSMVTVAFCLTLLIVEQPIGSLPDGLQRSVKTDQMEHVSLSQLVTATGGQTVGFDHAPAGFAAISIDSRKVRPGDLFWAIEGERHDGHHFLLEAYGRGAAAAVVRDSEQSRVGGPAIVVPDTLKALRDFAWSYRESRDALIVGVTGSFGKTTTQQDG